MLLNHKANDVDQYIKEKLDLEGKISHYSNIQAFLDTRDTAHINKSIVHRNGNGNKVNLMTSAVGHFQCHLSDCTKLCHCAIPTKGGTFCT